MNNLATATEMVDDILDHPELSAQISADGFIGLLRLAQIENEKDPSAGTDESKKQTY